MRSIDNVFDQCLAQPGIRNHLSPFRERQVAGHDYCRLLGPFRDNLEQELRADFRQRHITYFIDCDKTRLSISFPRETVNHRTVDPPRQLQKLEFPS
jgi:hypothetical protein